VRGIAARVLPLLPLVLLLGIAAGQVVLVHRADLHPWLGGGFGMFSTVDTRAIQAWQVGPHGEERLEVPSRLEDAAKRAKALPSEGRLAALARDLFESSSADVAVRVEVWETRFDSEMRPEAKQLRSVTVGGGSVR
jgi:hypothetical protein